MNCNNCPNQTDSKCCHQSIKPSASFDDRANDEADRHAQKMQEQRKSKREGWDGKKISFWSTDLLQIEIDNLNKRVKEQNNEINNQ